jgi:hypothetical protein
MAMVGRAGGWQTGFVSGGLPPMGLLPMELPQSNGDDPTGEHVRGPAPLSDLAAAEGGYSSPNRRPDPKRGRRHDDQRGQPADTRDGLVGGQLCEASSAVTKALLRARIFGSGIAVHRPLPRLSIVLNYGTTAQVPLLPKVAKCRTVQQ